MSAHALMNNFHIHMNIYTWVFKEMLWSSWVNISGKSVVFWWRSCHSFVSLARNLLSQQPLNTSLAMSHTGKSDICYYVVFWIVGLLRFSYMLAVENLNANFFMAHFSLHATFFQPKFIHLFTKEKKRKLILKVD